MNLQGIAQPSQGWAWRWTPSLLGLICLLAMTALYLSGAHEAYRAVLTAWGIKPFKFPFLDIGGSLSAWDCARRGIDVVIADPCDVLHRGYNYSPFWQTLSLIPVGLKDRAVVGFSLGIAFLLSWSLLPPAQSTLELLCRCVSSVSTMVVFAIERANPDIILFLMALAVAAAASGSFAWRSCAYAIAMLAAAIKYYPAMLLALVARERGWRLVVVGIVLSLTGAMFLYLYGADIRRGLPHVAAGSPFGDMFGAKNLAYGSYPLIHDALAAVGVSSTWTVRAANAFLQIVGLLGMAALAVKLWSGGDWRASVLALPTWTRDLLMCAALIIVGCFFAGQSVGYRGVFLLMALPGLAALARAGAGSSVVLGARFAMIAVIPVMWNRAIWNLSASSGNDVQPADMAWGLDSIVWLTNEVFWWLLILVLCMVLGGWIASWTQSDESGLSSDAPDECSKPATARPQPIHRSPAVFQ